MTAKNEKTHLIKQVAEAADDYRYRDALKLSDELLVLGDKDKEHIYYRSIWLYKVGEINEALAAVTEAIKLGFGHISAKVLYAKLLTLNKEYEKSLYVCNEYFELAPPAFGLIKADVLGKLQGSRGALDWLSKIITRSDCQTSQLVNVFLKLAAKPIDGLDYIKPVAQELQIKFPMFNAWGNEYLWYQDALFNSMKRVLEEFGASKVVPKIINTLYISKDNDHEGLWRWHTAAANAICEQNFVEQAPYDHGEKIRIGFVSSDFRNHSVAFFLKSIYDNVDRLQYELYSYHTSEYVDGTTTYFENKSTRFWFAGTMPDEELFKKIRKDQIDVLVDLNGYTSGHRLKVFSKRAAPLQISWLGYPYTTAVSNIDYRIVDEETDPVDTDEIYIEKLVRLKRLFIAYTPLADVAIEREPVKNEIIFGCFNVLNKINVNLIKIWARLLLEIKESRLVLKSRGVDSKMVQSRLQKMFSDEGVDSKRISFLERDPSQHSHLAQYNKIDIALDTFPYGGTTTTCEALFMGVPVATIMGKSHRSRVTHAILKAVGLEEFSTKEESFVDNLKRLCAKKDELTQLKIGLREKFLNSPVCDTQEFAEAWFNAVYELHVKKQNEAKQA